MKIFLVTAIGTAASTAIIQGLRSGIEDIRIIGGDINAPLNIVTSRDVDEFYVFPSVVRDSEYYYSFFKEFCVEHSVDYVFCTIDEEVFLLRSREDDLRKIGVELCLPDLFTVETCHFKDKFAQWIDNNFKEIAIDSFQSVNDLKEDCFPLFVKPKEGRASIGCRKIESADELGMVDSDAFFDNYIVQRYTDGDIVAVDIVRDRLHGITNVAQRVEYLRNSSGSGIAVEIVYDEELDLICRKLADRLDMNGVVNAEFFKTSEGYKIIEVNPRFPAGTKYTCMSGMDIVMDAYKIAAGKGIETESPMVGKRYARRYETYEMGMDSKWVV